MQGMDRRRVAVKILAEALRDIIMMDRRKNAGRFAFLIGQARKST